MKRHQLDAQTIHAAFLTACDFIITNRENLNAINLFPVADGDTGDNMAATALSVIHLSAVKPSLQETLSSLANSALLGARGNSGMIFSQFFNGLSEAALDTDQLDTVSFANLIAQAGVSVRSAILHPVEGTIITVIDAWSASLLKYAPDFACFKELMNQTLADVNQALQNTTGMLEVLQEAQVVDAGALGFYHFINGFADYLNNPRVLNMDHHDHDCVTAHHEVFAEGSPPLQRYCTEVLLTGESIDRIQLATELEQFGDSIVSSGNASLCRFHVHCTDPATVFKAVASKGKITQSKAQDMLRQFQMIHQRKHPIAIVTDSSADLPLEFMEEHQIHVIQLNMFLDGHHLLDKICVNQNTFYDELSQLKTYPKTSFPSPAILQEHLQHLANHYDQVLVLPISQALSGTHDAIVKASAGMNNLHVINTKQTSGGLGLLVKHAAQLIATGASIEQIKEELLSKIPKIHFYVYVNQFDSLIRSGRMSKFSGMLAQFAHLKPIIILNEEGKAALHDKAFSEAKALSKILAYVNKMREAQTIEAYGILHAGVPDKAAELARMTTEAFGKAPDFIEHASTVIGLHAGKGALGLVTLMG